MMIRRDRVFPIIGAKYGVIQNLSIAVHNFLIWETRKRVGFYAFALPPDKSGGYAQITPMELRNCSY